MKSVTISVNNFHNKSFEVIGENKEYKKINPTIPIFIVATSLISSPVTQPVSVKPYVSYANTKKHKTYTFSAKNDTISISMDNNNKEVTSMSEKFHAELKDSERYLLREIKSSTEQAKNDLSTQIGLLSNRVDTISNDINDLKLSISSLNSKVDNLPDKLKASKFDFIFKSLLIPVVVAVITGYVMIKLGLKTP